MTISAEPIRNDGKGCPCWFGDMGMDETGCRRVVLHIVPSCEHHWPLAEAAQRHVLNGISLAGPVPDLSVAELLVPDGPTISWEIRCRACGRKLLMPAAPDAWHPPEGGVRRLREPLRCGCGNTIEAAALPRSAAG